MRVVDHTPLLGDMTSAALVVIRLFVVDKKLTLLAVAVRLVSGNANNREDGIGLTEDGVHLFERSVGCLWVEEVYSWEDDGVAGTC